MSNKVDLTPPNGKVIIRKDEPPKRTQTGIHLRARDRVQSMTGTVVSCRSNRYELGDRIFFNPQISATINFGGENLVVIFEEDIMAKIL